MDIEDDDLILIVVKGENEDDETENNEHLANNAINVDELLETYTLDQYVSEEKESDYDDQSDGQLIKNKSKTGVKRKLIAPENCESYVESIRQDFPDLNTNDIIDKLVDFMNNVRAPTLAGHFRMVKSEYECIVCNTKMSNRGACDRHYLAQHGPRYLICLSCGADFRCTTNLYRHEKRCLSRDAPLVVKARRLFLKKRANGRSYLLLDKSKKRFFCNICPASFAVKVSLQAHERMHRSERPYGCHICGRAYTSKASLKKHMGNHNEPTFVCDNCGQVFKQRSSLVSHMYSHSLPRFPCKECPQRFTYSTALRLHVMRKHQNLPLPCACQICPKRFGRMWALKDHMKKDHGMTIMTRKMLYKQLPEMSVSSVNAMVVMKSDLPAVHSDQAEKWTPKSEAEDHFEFEQVKDEIECNMTVLDPETGQLIPVAVNGKELDLLEDDDEMLEN